MNVISVV